MRPVVRSCPKCGGTITYEQRVMFVRQGDADIETSGPRQGRLVIWERSAWALTPRPVGRTVMFCDSRCDGESGYIDTVPASGWRR